ncbi:MAG: GTPase HflX, partial [Thermoguttaceae bacterium]|nr:GTPase HflX [Thermoguttaceae bacterium]
RYPLAVTLSAKDGTGVEKLRQAAGELLSREFLELTITAPIADGRLGAMLAREGEVLWRDYDAEQSLGIFRVRVPRPLLGRLREIPGITITGENLPDETVNDGF